MKVPRPWRRRRSGRSPARCATRAERFSYLFSICGFCIFREIFDLHAPIAAARRHAAGEGHHRRHRRLTVDDRLVAAEGDFYLSAVKLTAASPRIRGPYCWRWRKIIVPAPSSQRKVTSFSGEWKETKLKFPSSSQLLNSVYNWSKKSYLSWLHWKRIYARRRRRAATRRTKAGWGDTAPLWGSSAPFLLQWQSGCSRPSLIQFPALPYRLILKMDNT